MVGFTYTLSRVYPPNLPSEVECSFSSPTPVPNDPVVSNNLLVLVTYEPDVTAARQVYTGDRQGQWGDRRPGTPDATGLCSEFGTTTATDLGGLGDQAFVLTTCHGLGSDEHHSFDMVALLKGSTYVKVFGAGYPQSLEQVAHYVLDHLM
jgi:hypothetical protein